MGGITGIASVEKAFTLLEYLATAGRAASLQEILYLDFLETTKPLRFTAGAPMGEVFRKYGIL